jgi:hypothetical protein
MSRPIKFRQKLKPAFAKIHGEDFHYWGYIDGGFVSPMGKTQIEGDDQQFTGKTDNSQPPKEIYEGDIISSPHFKDAAGRQHTLKHIVQWSEDYHGWFLLNMDSMNPNDGSLLLFVARNGDLQVIGNIYENPELLEKNHETS